ncbi:MAG: enoyl-CoA hydratase/isomerase family protein [SAR324 cluster bacterium]|nr:enoyl-CoA hydratase/isomerase family protein [SAR324 cluster bacterium]
METMALSKEGSVYVLTLTNNATGNAFTLKALEEYHAVFDQIEQSGENCSLVVTSSDPKSWCTGIDLEWMKTQPENYFPEFGQLLDKFFIRLALLPVPTIGCLTGHTFAGGAIMAACFDFRLMRKDKGWFCLPEVDINIPFTPVMHQIISLFPNQQALKELVLTGKRIGGQEAADSKLVDSSWPDAELKTKTMELAQILAGKNRKVYASIKRGLKSNLK